MAMKKRSSYILIIKRKSHENSGRDEIGLNRHEKQLYQWEVGSNWAKCLQVEIDHHHLHRSHKNGVVVYRLGCISKVSYLGGTAAWLRTKDDIGFIEDDGNRLGHFRSTDVALMWQQRADAAVSVTSGTVFGDWRDWSSPSASWSSPMSAKTLSVVSGRKS
ncbi:hypothetical protein Acr_00g0024110 [Actinidia rufa]|uniref:Uncharacterized protein n=1 Tax=Actinidia rufa TaxID=165716 RepID=A0A7J0DD03_9ERIC|nr:hypothetical protein Acr_00g0024110 [Actinidia rufa]